MPWISQKAMDLLVDSVAEAEATRHAVLRELRIMRERLADVPRLTVEAMRELPAKVLAPVVDQPPSIAVADKRRVAEAREREKETR